MSGVGTIRVYRPDPATSTQTERYGRAVFATRLLSPSLVIVTIDGDIDATNGRALGRYVERHASASSQLIVDLSGVKFFGAQGFTALHYVKVCCDHNNVDWAIVGDTEVRRLLRICDPDDELPTEPTREQAARRLSRVARGRFAVSQAG